MVVGSGGEPRAEVGTNGGGEPRAEVGTNSGGEPRAEVGTNGGVEPRAEVGTNSGGEPRAEVGTNGGGEPRAEVGTNSGGEPRAEVGTNGGGEPRAEVGTNGGCGGEPRAEVGTNGGGEPRAEVGTNGGGEPRAEVGTNGGGEPRAEVGTNGGVEPRSVRLLGLLLVLRRVHDQQQREVQRLVFCAWRHAGADVKVEVDAEVDAEVEGRTEADTEITARGEISGVADDVESDDRGGADGPASADCPANADGPVGADVLTPMSAASAASCCSDSSSNLGSFRFPPQLPSISADLSDADADFEGAGGSAGEGNARSSSGKRGLGSSAPHQMVIKSSVSHYHLPASPTVASTAETLEKYPNDTTPASSGGDGGAGADPTGAAGAGPKAEASSSSSAAGKLFVRVRSMEEDLEPETRSPHIHAHYSQRLITPQASHSLSQHTSTVGSFRDQPGARGPQNKGRRTRRQGRSRGRVGVSVDEGEEEVEEEVQDGGKEEEEEGGREEEEEGGRESEEDIGDDDVCGAHTFDEACDVDDVATRAVVAEPQVIGMSESRTNYVGGAEEVKEKEEEEEGESGAVEAHALRKTAPRLQIDTGADNRSPFEESPYEVSPEVLAALFPEQSGTGPAASAEQTHKLLSKDTAVHDVQNPEQTYLDAELNSVSPPLAMGDRVVDGAPVRKSACASESNESHCTHWYTLHVRPRY